MVTWDTIECIERNGIIIGYTVVFQEQGGATIPGEVMGQSFTANDLTPGKSYTFQVAGVNDDGTGPFTETTITTDEEGYMSRLYIMGGGDQVPFAYIMIPLPTVPGPVSDLTALPKFTSIDLTWSAPQEPNGVIISYEVTYRVTGSNLVTTNTTDLSTTFSISSLTPQTTVSYISVSAYTSAGRGEASIPDQRTLSEPRE